MPLRLFKRISTNILKDLKFGILLNCKNNDCFKYSSEL